MEKKKLKDKVARKKADHICFERIVSSEYAPARFEAEKSFLTHSKIIGAAIAGTLNASDVFHPSAAIITLKKWETGRTINCRFLDGIAKPQNRVKTHAKEWEDFANITFNFVATNTEQIRISFSADPGSWSAIETDALIEKYLSKYQPTMNFGWLKDDTDDIEYRRVVVHEFGHALGLIHEHQSPSEIL